MESIKCKSYSFLAIVQLDTPVKLFETSKGRICLPNDQHKPSKAHTCFVAGWGQTKEGVKKYPDKLRHVSVLLVSRKTCNLKESYGGSITKLQQCAGYKEGGKDACANDSGGSLVCNVDGNFFFFFRNFIINFLNITSTIFNRIFIPAWKFLSYGKGSTENCLKHVVLALFL